MNSNDGELDRLRQRASEGAQQAKQQKYEQESAQRAALSAAIDAALQRDMVFIKRAIERALARGEISIRTKGSDVGYRRPFLRWFSRYVVEGSLSGYYKNDLYEIKLARLLGEPFEVTGDSVVVETGDYHETRRWDLIISWKD